MSIPTRIHVLGAVLIGIAALAAPAAAQAGADAAVSQVESADPVVRGAQVTYTVTIANLGDEPAEDLFVDLFSLRPGTHSAVDNPYLSASPSQGGCEIGRAGDYHDTICELGTLAPGASATITAVVRANESMDHEVGLIHCNGGCFGGYGDDEIENNDSSERTTVSVPPEVSGSRKLRLKGLPTGCAANDFKLRVRAKGKRVKAVSAELRGPDFFKQRLGKTKRRKLKTTVPVAGLEQASDYELRVVATRKGRKALKRAVTFQRC